MAKRNDLDKMAKNLMKLDMVSLLLVDTKIKFLLEKQTKENNRVEEAQKTAQQTA